MALLAKGIQALLDRAPSERRLGPFELLEQLGHGGFAPVWLAREVCGAAEIRAAAVKLFSLREGADDGEITAVDREQIVAEARALSRVLHRNVVAFYALSIDEPLGVMGLAMEHVAGTPLDRKLASEGRLSVTETIAVGSAVASALAAVHHAGLVHRDVKPGNVVETADDYKLIDFGIAAAEPREPRASASEGDASRAALGGRISGVELAEAVGVGGSATKHADVVSGTAGYIDPTCVATRAAATAASDIYALGVMLFECLAGQRPTAIRETPDGLRICIETVPSLLELRPDVPPALVQLIHSLLIPQQSRRPSSAEWVATRLAHIRTEIAGIAPALPPEGAGPFRGLGRYTEGDRGIYFGRSSEIASALEILRARGLVALVGPSGSGKSSLARAGILPAVMDGALGRWPKRWEAAIAEPGKTPRAAMGAALRPFVPDAAAMEPDAVVFALAERAKETGCGVILLVDQLEELAAVSRPEGRAWTAALLTRFGERAIPGVLAIVTARRDMLDALLAVGDLGTAIVRRTVLIEPINEIVWGDVLDQSLAAYGYSFEDPALRAELLADLGASTETMPHVQFALAELWSKRDPATKTVTRAGLKAIGGSIAGALERHADATMAALRSAHGDAAAQAARRILLALTTPQGTRATLPDVELLKAGGTNGQDALRTLEDARLIVPGADGMTLAHEALLTEWRALRGWVGEAREDRLLVAELESDAARWAADPKGAPLWRGIRLAGGERLCQRGEHPISADGAAFVQASRRARMVAIGSAGMIVMALLAAGAAYVRGLKLELDRETISREAAEEKLRADALALEAARSRDKARIKEAEAEVLLKRLEQEQDKTKRLELEGQIRTKLSEIPPVKPPPATPTATAAPLPLPSAAPGAQPSAVASPASSAPPSPSVKPVRRPPDSLDPPPMDEGR